MCVPVCTRACARVCACACVCVHVCAHAMTKSNLGGEGLLQLTADSLSLKGDEAGPDAETAEQCAFLAHSLWRYFQWAGPSCIN